MTQKCICDWTPIKDEWFRWTTTAMGLKMLWTHMWHTTAVTVVEHCPFFSVVSSLTEENNNSVYFCLSWLLECLKALLWLPLKEHKPLPVLYRWRVQQISCDLCPAVPNIPTRIEPTYATCLLGDAYVYLHSGCQCLVLGLNHDATLWQLHTGIYPLINVGPVILGSFVFFIVETSALLVCFTHDTTTQYYSC